MQKVPEKPWKGLLRLPEYKEMENNTVSRLPVMTIVYLDVHIFSTPRAYPKTTFFSFPGRFTTLHSALSWDARSDII